MVVADRGVARTVQRARTEACQVWIDGADLPLLDVGICASTASGQARGHRHFEIRSAQVHARVMKSERSERRSADLSGGTPIALHLSRLRVQPGAARSRLISDCVNRRSLATS